MWWYGRICISVRIHIHLHTNLHSVEIRNEANEWCRGTAVTQVSTYLQWISLECFHCLKLINSTNIYEAECLTYARASPIGSDVAIFHVHDSTKHRAPLFLARTLPT